MSSILYGVLSDYSYQKRQSIWKWSYFSKLWISDNFNTSRWHECPSPELHSDSWSQELNCKFSSTNPAAWLWNLQLVANFYSWLDMWLTANGSQKVKMQPMRKWFQRAMRSTLDSLRVLKARSSGWRSAWGQNPLTFQYWHCSSHVGCYPEWVWATTAARWSGWWIEGERFEWKS